MSAPGDTMTPTEMAAAFGSSFKAKYELVTLIEHDGESMWRREGGVWVRLQGEEDL